MVERKYQHLQLPFHCLNELFKGIWGRRGGSGQNKFPINFSAAETGGNMTPSG